MEASSSVKYVVLGMLGFGAKTGYDIKGIVERSTRFFWAASYGQIYPELGRLERAGLIVGTDAPRGARRRKEYELTDAGRAELLEWLQRPPEMPELRDESLLKLFFADELPLEEAVEQLRMRRQGHEEFLAILRDLAERPGDDPPFVDLVLRYGIAYAEFNVAWCERYEAELRKAAEAA